jgi:cytidine deaminase
VPTGSLCAERNAISTAVSIDPTLRRRDFRMIAVVGVPLNPPDSVRRQLFVEEKDDEESEESVSNLGSTSLASAKETGHPNPLSPCGVCTEVCFFAALSFFFWFFLLCSGY